MSEPADLKYRAFISYSHADTGWAKWLHRGLEAFHIDKDLAGRVTATGPIPQALRPIFRDRDEFTAGHALAEQTLAALDDSHALIVICSPASAKSRYVNEEVRLFKSRHPERPVIPLIVDGKPDDPERECFPPALKFALDASGQITADQTELLAADARENGDGKNLALAKVIAGLLGVSSDEIFRRAERERRAAMRRRRRVQTLIGVLAVLLAAAGIGWLEQDLIKEEYYQLVKVRPYVLTAEAESTLKPGETFKECADHCSEMIVVPSGSFVMGSLQDVAVNYYEHPQHDVTIAHPFAVSKFEVTFDQWDACVNFGPCRAVSDSHFGRGDRPVINVHWEDAKQFVAWLSKTTGKPYRLPTDAEWEYVARAGTSSSYFFGTDPAALDQFAWYRANSDDRTQPVGKKSPNQFGLYDISGNVWELVEDRWHKSYVGAPVDGSAWMDSGDSQAGTSDLRVMRGGSWQNEPFHLRSASRLAIAPQNTFNSNVGFRVARTIDQ